MWDPKKEKGIWSEFAEDELLENIDPDEDTLPAEDDIDSWEEMQEQEYGEQGVEGIYNWEEWN